MKIGNTLANEGNKISIQTIDHDLPIESTEIEENRTNQASLSNYKGYLWANKPMEESKEIIGKVGNPRNILNTSRQQKQSANSP
ncbi:hypothetical protein O181_090923 [Austropuccinia psidii MF-1]|uniref:Uncharacterized protein n=1 Tax=Austropuccinia psidii MF-1 TaxID=1389203 RepID=A0A9Q3P705_9BASI|nr:hypothetical protein [Austropuccinia psidii MF-1]